MEPILSVEKLSVRFGGLQAVSDASFAVAENEIVGVIGPNGAGKSTLFSMIAGTCRPDSGRTRFRGEDITWLRDDATARKGLARTFQTPRPFTSMNFLDNVSMGALTRTMSVAKARRAALSALDNVGLADFADRPASGASTGQRKRLEIARVLATEPSVLLLDEPLGGVDLASVDGIIDLLAKLRAQGLTLIIVEHNIDALLQIADRFVAMVLGRKLDDGPPREVITNAELVRAYLGGDDDAAA